MMDRGAKGQKVLLVDLGNTSLKWAWIEAGGIGERHAVAYARLGIDLAAKGQWAGLERPDQLFVSSVAAADTDASLRGWLEAQWGIAPVFAAASASALGVINGYDTPGQLGVDRWLALVAVREEIPDRDCLVVDCGTAITIDGITRDGRHLGGTILPGFGLMRDALRRQTAIPWPGLTDQAPPMMATNTGDAIAGGGVHAVAALVEKMARQLLEQAGEAPVLVLAGSDAELLRQVLQCPVEVRPDLVMQGLALYALTKMEE